MGTRAVTRALVPGLLLLMVAGLTACGAGTRQMLRVGKAVEGRPRVALLPLEDLSGRASAGEIFNRILFARLVAKGNCEVVESGIVDEALDSLSIRNTGSLGKDQILDLGRRLDTRFLLTGTLLESGTIKVPDGELPAVGIALKLLEVPTQRIVWAEVRFRTGEDRETIFGWGRQRNLEELAGELADRVLRDFRITSADSTAGREGGTR